MSVCGYILLALAIRAFYRKLGARAPSMRGRIVTRPAAFAPPSDTCQDMMRLMDQLCVERAEAAFAARDRDHLAMYYPPGYNPKGPIK